MDNRTKEALLASIEKWEKNASGPMRKANVTVGSCALCLLFFDIYREDGNLSCTGCPVAEKTGRRFCSDTPYYDADTAYQSNDERAFRAAALAEVAFLKSLLPEDDNGNRD